MDVDEIRDVGALERMNAGGLVRLRDIPEYSVWIDMKQRCHNPNNKAWKWYGGRGIRVCDEWLEDFWAFLWHVGLRPTDGFWMIERINNDLGYEPGNVTWATVQEQCWNRRSSGGVHPGERNGRAKLNWEQVREIRALRGIATLRVVAEDYAISLSQVRMIWNNQQWIEEEEEEVDLTPYDRGFHRRGENNARALLSDVQAAEVKYLALEGRLSQQAIGNLYGVSRQVVAGIKYGQSWWHIKPIEPTLKWPSIDIKRRF